MDSTNQHTSAWNTRYCNSARSTAFTDRPWVENIQELLNRITSLFLSIVLYLNVRVIQQVTEFKLLFSFIVLQESASVRSKSVH